LLVVRITERELIDLLAAAQRLEPDLRGATYETLFGLLAGTGLRISEALMSMAIRIDPLADNEIDPPAGADNRQFASFSFSR